MKDKLHSTVSLIKENIPSMNFQGVQVGTIVTLGHELEDEKSK
jgi:hypothetical protein